ncbi:hypothetical protein EXT42_18650 [Pseudoalteromonas sp. CO302Y]|uniref:hypothetical protein n=2 Tax=Pseudoalteromonas TaxID=53246 RepID=UPI001022EDB4|nr:hypothetical protein EXT42_18650 [Pseudoalteromonas sp. CO302Y]RZG06263.1 hypothetical protein EXT40_18655 [Pseudoalteromonas sp. CO133X]
MSFQDLEDITLSDFADLFSALDSSSKFINELDNDAEDLIVKKLSLNSPFSLELIAAGFGTVYILVQIFDKVNSWRKTPHEINKLKLENEKLQLEMSKIRNDNMELNKVLTELNNIRFKLDKLQIEKIDKKSQ